MDVNNKVCLKTSSESTVFLLAASVRIQLHHRYNNIVCLSGIAAISSLHAFDGYKSWEMGDPKQVSTY
jgi:hypothetical protein